MIDTGIIIQSPAFNCLNSQCPKIWKPFLVEVHLIVEIGQWARNLCELSTLLAVISDGNLVETDACERMKQTLISSIKLRKPRWDNRHLERSIQVVSFFIFTH